MNGHKLAKHFLLVALVLLLGTPAFVFLEGCQPQQMGVKSGDDLSPALTSHQREVLNHRKEKIGP